MSPATRRCRYRPGTRDRDRYRFPKFLCRWSLTAGLAENSSCGHVRTLSREFSGVQLGRVLTRLREIRTPDLLFGAF